VKVLVTRPRPEADRTAAALARKGYQALLAPMLEIEAVDAAIGAGPWAGLILTSGNAARALADHPMLEALRPLRGFTVGKRTERAARALGFQSVASVGGDSEDLVQVIMARGSADGVPYLYLAGNDRARDLAGELGAHGIGVETVVIYRANAAVALPEESRDALLNKSVGAILHYSRRTAAIFCDCVEAAELVRPVNEIPHYVLSERVAEPLAAAGVNDVHVAESPDEDALLGLLPPA
jgi:uroporphyrinogen-III synthase